MAEIERVRRITGGALPAFAETTWASLLAQTAAPLGRFDPATIEGLPPPARRFLSRALPPTVPLSKMVELEMEGEIRLGGRWLPFTARQILRAGSGFVWAPTVGGRLLRFCGADTFGPEGAGIEFRLHGRIPVVRKRDDDVRRSAQGRLAAETVAWLPQALTPQAGARWTGIDDQRAIVTIEAAGVDIDVEITVDDDGQLVRIGLQRWNDSLEPPAAAPFGGAVDTVLTAPNGVGVAGSGCVGWDWDTAQESEGVFFRYRVVAARFPDEPPHDTVSDALVERLVRAAVQAPSSHNTQPWRFAPLDRGVAVLADRTRALPVNDPFDRELTISCGAAIHNIETAARGLGFESTVHVVPEPSDPDRLADVHLDATSRAGDVADLAVFGSRHTTRHAFAQNKIAELRELVDSITDHGSAVTFAVIEPERRERLAALVAEGDRAQFADGGWRRELTTWMRRRRSGDGLVVSSITGLATRMIVKRFDVGASTAEKDHELAMAAPLLIVVGSERDDPAAWIEVGRHLQRLLLRAARHDVQAGFLNQPCQVAELRTQLHDLVPEAGVPQLIIRLGHPTRPIASTPRRPIGDVFSDLSPERDQDGRLGDVGDVADATDPPQNRHHDQTFSSAQRAEPTTEGAST